MTIRLARGRVPRWSLRSFLATVWHSWRHWHRVYRTHMAYLCEHCYYERDIYE